MTASASTFTHSLDVIQDLFSPAHTPVGARESLHNVLGHGTLLTAAVAAVIAIGVGLAQEPNDMLISVPSAIGCVVLLAFVAIGVIRTSYRFVGYGAVTVGGLAATMLAGEYFFDDGVYLGGVYLGFVGMLAFVALMLWIDMQPRGEHAA